MSSVSGWDRDDVIIKAVDATGNNNRVRHFSSVLGSADQDLVRLFDGNAFCLTIEYRLDASQTKYQSFKTPNTTGRIYLRYKTYSADRSQIQFLENPTGVVYNFTWTGRDRNRETSNTPAAVIKDVTSLTSAGTFLCKEANYGSGYTVNQSPINYSPFFKLDQNTEYIFAMVSYADNNFTTLQFEWYEL